MVAILSTHRGAAMALGVHPEVGKLRKAGIEAILVATLG
jgi:hypothetical protein